MDTHHPSVFSEKEINDMTTFNKNLQLTLVLTLIASAICHSSQAAWSAPTRAVARPPGRPMLMRQAPASDAAAGREYSGRLWNRILNQWDYPNGNNHVTLMATLSGEGNVESVQLSSSPKSAEAEASAQSAFEKAKPLDALPKGMASAKVTIVFNSKSDPHGDSSSGGSVRLDPINNVRVAPVVEEARPEAKPEAKPEVKLEPKQELKVEPKVEIIPEVKTETETKVEVKTETKVEDEFGSGAGNIGK